MKMDRKFFVALSTKPPVYKPEHQSTNKQHHQRNCCRQPLKVGIQNDIIARHPELRLSLLASALKTYARSQGCLETLMADLDPNSQC
jgi:hypothetical protein